MIYKIKYVEPIYARQRNKRSLSPSTTHLEVIEKQFLSCWSIVRFQVCNHEQLKFCTIKSQR